MLACRRLPQTMQNLTFLCCCPCNVCEATNHDQTTRDWHQLQHHSQIHHNLEISMSMLWRDGILRNIAFTKRDQPRARDLGPFQQYGYALRCWPWGHCVDHVFTLMGPGLVSWIIPSTSEMIRFTWPLSCHSKWALQDVAWYQINISGARNKLTFAETKIIRDI